MSKCFSPFFQLLLCFFGVLFALYDDDVAPTPALTWKLRSSSAQLLPLRLSLGHMEATRLASTGEGGRLSEIRRRQRRRRGRSENLPVARRCVCRRRRPTTPRHRFHIWTGSTPASWHTLSLSVCVCVCGSHSLLGEEGFFLLLLLEIPRKPFGKSSDDPGLSLSLSQLGRGKWRRRSTPLPGCLTHTGSGKKIKQNKKSLLLSRRFLKGGKKNMTPTVAALPRLLQNFVFFSFLLVG